MIEVKEKGEDGCSWVYNSFIVMIYEGVVYILSELDSGTGFVPVSFGEHFLPLWCRGNRVDSIYEAIRFDDNRVFRASREELLVLLEKHDGACTEPFTCQDLDCVNCKG